MVRPALRRRFTAACLVVLMLVTTGCSGGGSGAEPPPYLVSYSQAAALLGRLDPTESTEQIRDWARLGLAASLDLNRDQVVDNLYDSAPLRDPAFADLVRQPTGPGRSLFDGTTLHVLVPADDPHRSRTIGLAIDQHRTDAGGDPPRLQVHTYRILPQANQIELMAEDPAPTGTVRTGNGWHEARIDQQGELAAFLANTDHLSRVDTRGTQVWAAGWRWPGTSGGRITPDDVAVLQRGYRQPDGFLPGFSLDPKAVSDPGDVQAILPGLAPAITRAITSGRWAGSGYASAAELRNEVSNQLYQPSHASGLPDDRTELWTLLNVLDGKPAYNEARYDGGLAGTEVGMTAAYTDLVAKDWVTGVGTGVPGKAVPGFVPNPAAPTPDSLCASHPREETGRLWFGQADDAFAYTSTSVDIGATATRLYSRSNDVNGTEVAPSHSFGRALHWWDQHYQQIADYEPEYSRLDQLMRWSGALEWLAKNGKELPATVTGGNLRFADWYAKHNELRERTPLRVVTPPSAKQEAVLTTPSETFPNCGLLGIVGGVSLADGLLRGGDLPSGNTNLPPGMRRAGPTDPATTRMDAGSGTVDRVTRGDNSQVTSRKTIGVQRGPDVTRIVVTNGTDGAVPWAGTPYLSGHNELRTTIQTGDRSVTADVQFGATSVVRESAREIPNSGARRQADITAQDGMALHMAEVAKLVARDPVHGLDNVPGVQYRYQDPLGNTLYRFNGGWIEVGTGGTSSIVLATIDVATPQGVVHVREVAPKTLAKDDLDHARPVSQLVVPAEDAPGQVRPADHVYMDTSSLAATEPTKTLPTGLPAKAKVKIVTLETTPTKTTPSTANSPGGGGPPNRTWTLADGSFDGGDGGGGSGPGGGLSIGDLVGLGGAIVLISVCSDDDKQQDKDEECD